VTKFRVCVWCDACWGDPEGCFGGASELLTSRFVSREEAEAAALKYCGNLPYRYRVEESGGQNVDVLPVSVDETYGGLPLQ
jgi:hypothetical protein